jgi:hypothetical protein
MHIYNQEKLDGLEEILQTKASISTASLAQPSNPIIATKTKEIKSIASLSDDDLYYVQSILVTSSWNKNDDIFDKSEVWKARSTPSHKPTNLEHDENTIIGHITANWPMTEDGMLIDENTPIENLPHKYHILTGSVIYKGFSDPALRDRALKLIAEIEDGHKYVSMECYFKGFNYGILNKTTGKYQVLSRGEDTAYLTKYLRAYGGAGEHENYRIGRVLKDITFSGKGYVNQPANPESIIFTKDNIKFEDVIPDEEMIASEKNTVFENIGVFSNQANLKENNMSLEAETKIEASNECTEAQASVFSLTEKTTQLEKDLAETRAALEILQSEKELAAKKAKEDEDAKDEENKNLKAALESANEVIAGYKAKEEEMTKKEKKSKRMAALVQNGIDSEVAEATVEKFDSLDDDSFDAMTSLLAAKKNKPMEDEKEMDKEEASQEVDSSVLDNVEVDKEIDLSVGGSVTTEVESTRAALVDFVYNRLGKKLNKGE